MRKTAILVALACAFARADYGPGTTDSDLLRSGTPVVTNAWLAVSNETVRIARSVAGDAGAITDGTNRIDATRDVWRMYSGRVCTNESEVWTYSVGGATHTAEQMEDAVGGGDSDYSQTLVWMNTSFLGKDGEEEYEGWFVLNGSGTAPLGYSYTTGDIPESSANQFLALAEYVGFDYAGGTNVSITAFRGTFESGTNYVGRLALTNDIPASVFADLTPATNYANQVVARVAADATNYTDAAIATLSQTNPVLAGGPYLQTSSNALDHTVRVQYGTGPGGFTFSPDEIYVPGAAYFESFWIASNDNRGPLSGIGQYGGAFSSARSEMETYVTSSLSEYATHAQVLAAASSATNYTDGAISTNNAAFVSAVLAVPLTGADAGDLAEIAEYGGYGTVGAAILALIAGLAALKRRIGTAETELAGKMPMYPMVAVTPSSGTLTVAPYTVATYTAGTTAAAFTVAVGAGTTGTARDCELVIDCTATGAVAPTVTWPSNFHPRTDAETDFACEAGVRNVYYISEYASGEFVVGGWQETDNTGGTTVNESSEGNS